MKDVNSTVRQLMADEHPVRGIFVGLDEELYHSVPNLGSSNLKTLLQSPSEYWWESYLNPERDEDRDSPALKFGSAMHTRILLGEEFFNSLYVRRPDSVERMTAAIKADLAPNGETILSGADYDRICKTGEVIAADPNLQDAFDEGVPELSVFWTDESRIPLKARFDYFKYFGIGDLKTAANTYRRPFREVCLRAIETYRYDMQAAHYLDARAQMRGLVEQGLVFGASENIESFIAEASQEDQTAFQFVFIQSNGAPNVWSGVITPGNPILDTSRMHIDLAKTRWLTYRERYGDSRWTIVHPVSEIDVNDFKPWAFAISGEEV